MARRGSDPIGCLLQPFNIAGKGCARSCLSGCLLICLFPAVFLVGAAWNAIIRK